MEAQCWIALNINHVKPLTFQKLKNINQVELQKQTGMFHEENNMLEISNVSVKTTTPVLSWAETSPKNKA
ncbi:hypothetical protein HanRHA438_Chr09g0380221 [Helianthus annuus]|nr:hypothetical protein HanRHA438_Chr09g0380221 [Helianthus annuus]